MCFGKKYLNDRQYISHFIDEDNFVVFYYFTTSEIWFNKEGWLLVGGALKEGSTVLHK